MTVRDPVEVESPTAEAVASPAPAAVSVVAIHHVGLLVDDLSVALPFYTGVLGLRLLPDRPDFGVPGVWLEVGEGQQLHLFEGDTPRDGGQHVALGVADLDGALDRLRERDIKIRSFPKDGPFTQAVVHDPCGNRVELYLV
jgi:lactoylglutathione lyase